MKDLCRTRWIERIDAFSRFKALHPAIVSSFEAITLEGTGSWSRDAITDASTLLLAIITTDFITALVIAHSLPELSATINSQSPICSKRYCASNNRNRALEKSFN